MLFILISNTAISMYIVDQIRHWLVVSVFLLELSYTIDTVKFSVIIFVLMRNILVLMAVAS